jgi:hypothetical protein
MVAAASGDLTVEVQHDSATADLETFVNAFADLAMFGML